MTEKRFTTSDTDILCMTIIDNENGKTYGFARDIAIVMNELNDENKELKDFNHYLIKLEKELRQERNQLMNPLYLWVDKKIRQLELKIDEAEGYKFLQLQYQSKIEVLKELREELQE